MVLVREATTADAAGIAAVQVRGWLATYRGLMPDAFLAEQNVEEATTRVTQSLTARRGDVLVATTGDRTVVGFCWMTRARDADLSEDVVEIVAIYVDPNHFRQGLGRELASAACALAVRQQGRRVVLWVFRENAGARAFYAAQGFSEDGTRKTTSRWGGVPLEEVRYARELVIPVASGLTHR